jgi:hypothetical protein
VRRKAAFDPETIAVLSAALDEAWDRLIQSGSECTRPAYARAMREVVARRIIDMAQPIIDVEKTWLPPHASRSEYKDAAQRDVSVPVSLSGFAAALDFMESQ